MKALIIPAVAVCFFAGGIRAASAQTWFRVGNHFCRERDSRDKPFFEAVKRGNIQSIRRFLRGGANPDLKDDCGIPVINYAVKSFRPEVLKILVEAGADLNVVDGFYRRPLLFWVLDAPDAAKNGAKIYESVRLLINHGANVDLRGESTKSALIEAVIARQTDLAALLIAAGANLDFRDDEDRTAYSYAAETGNEKLKKILVDAGADTRIGVEEYLRKYAENAFFQAAADGRTDIVEALLNEGMDVNAVNAGRMTALMRTTGESTLELLIKAGADVNLSDNAGFTALIWAAAFRRADIVKRLIAAGADVNAKTLDGKTALEYAADSETRAALIKAGAKEK